MHIKTIDALNCDNIFNSLISGHVVTRRVVASPGTLDHDPHAGE